MAFVLGCMMVFAGVTGGCAYFFDPGKSDAVGWMFVEAILAFILGCVVLSNQLATEAVVPLFFGMWILFSGVIRLVLSLTLKKAGDKSWIYVLVLGVLATASGVYAFFNQIAAGIAVISLVGISFLLQGINVLVAGIFMPGKKRKKVS